MDATFLVVVSHLNPVQQADISDPLDPELFTKTPGFMNLVYHNVRLEEEVQDH